MYCIKLGAIVHDQLIECVDFLCSGDMLQKLHIVFGRCAIGIMFLRGYVCVVVRDSSTLLSRTGTTTMVAVTGQQQKQRGLYILRDANLSAGYPTFI